MDGSKSGRLFNEKEIGALVQRATELHEEAKGESARSLSLDEIEQIAEELGVPSEFLRAAAVEVENDRDGAGTFRLLGGPFVIHRTLVVDETMSDDQWGDIVLKLRAAAGGPGEITTVGKSKEWFRSIGDGDGGFNITKTRVSVSSGEGETIVRLEKRFGVAAFMAYLAAVIPVLVLMGIMLTDGGANPFAGVGLSLAILGAARALVSLWKSREEGRFHELSNFIVDTLATPSTGSTAGETSTELIDIPGVDAIEGSSEAKKSRVRG